MCFQTENTIAGHDVSQGESLKTENTLAENDLFQGESLNTEYYSQR